MCLNNHNLLAQNLIVNWAQDGIMDYHYMIRYTSTIV